MAEAGGSLSGGERQGLAIVRALHFQADIIILDEPTMGLDPKARHQIFEMVATLNEEGRSVLLVEQNVRIGLGVATHGVVMESGKVRLQGAARDVLENPEIADLYLGGHIHEANGNGKEETCPRPRTSSSPAVDTNA